MPEPIRRTVALPACLAPASVGHSATRRRLVAALPLLSAIAIGGLAGPARAGLPEVIAAAKPAVVGIGTYDALANPRFTFRGTGFVVGDGLTIITNAHVLPPPETTPMPQMALIVPRRREGVAEIGDSRLLKVVYINREHDLALLRAEGTPLPALKLAPDGTAREGQAVALIGFPLGNVLGFSHVSHRGIISSITPIVLPQASSGQLDAAAVARMRRGGVFDILQLDATAYPGNSGGPLLDAETGEVLGVMNMVVLKSTRESALSAPSGISYAIPVQHVRALMDRR